MSLLVSNEAPDFTATAYHDGEFKTIKLSEFRGKKVVLFFYPLDFTFVCPTEIVAFSEAKEEFDKRDTVVLGCSVDSQHTHRAWAEVDRKSGGIKGVNFPLLSDMTREIAESYNVLLPGGYALRGLFIINKAGVIKHMTVNHTDLGRNVEEVLRLVDAIEHSEEYGEVCPANWHKGTRAMKPTVQSLQDYSSQHEMAGAR